MHDKLYGKKRLIITIIFTVIIHLIPTMSMGQSTWSEMLMEWMEETAVQTDDTGINWEEIMEELSDLFDTPINLNTATRKELQRFPFLSDTQIENIQAYVYLKGEMQTLHELLLVEEMDRKTIDLLMPFVVVLPASLVDRDRKSVV